MGRLERRVLLGLEIESTRPKTKTQNVTLHHEDEVISVQVERMTKNEWSQISVGVIDGIAAVTVDCKEYGSVKMGANKRGKKNKNNKNKVLAFDASSTLYIGQAGPVLKGAFEGVLQTLKITTDFDPVQDCSKSSSNEKPKKDDKSDFNEDMNVNNNNDHVNIKPEHALDFHQFAPPDVSKPDFEVILYSTCTVTLGLVKSVGKGARPPPLQKNVLNANYTMALIPRLLCRK